MKKLLIILGWPPYPLNQGGNQAVFNSIDALREDLDIYLIYPGNKAESYGPIYLELSNQWKNVTILPYLKPNNTSNKYLIFKKVYKRICALFLNSIPEYILDRELNEEMECIDEGFLDHIHSVIKKYDIKYVQTEFNQTLSIVHTLPDDVEKIFVHHEIRFVRNMLLLKKFGVNYSSFFNYKVKSQKTREISLLNKYDKVITLSLEDKKKLENAGVKSKIIPSFAIVKNDYEFTPSNKIINVVTFVGPEQHIPNKMGVEWFINNCLDSLIIKVPNVEFHIVGNWSKQTKKGYSQRKEIKFLGFVDNLQLTLQNSIMIVPIMIGSGIRMKILEASAMGIPFVTTTVGVEGMPFKNGEDCIIADMPNDFVDGIVWNMQSADNRKLAESAYNKYKEKYSIESLRNSRIKIYE
jgi:glycosyltransferase involved in cell wall biosynthesis